MLHKRKELILKLIVGILFISIIISLINIFTFKLYESFFWLCYTGMLIIAIGIMQKKYYLILSQIIILAIPDILWIIDFFYILFTGNSLFQLSTYFFEDRPLIAKLVSLQHLYVIPLALYTLYFFKISKLDKKKSLQFAAVQLIIFFILGMMFTTQETNINCVYELCFDISITNWLATNFPYGFAWFLVMYSMMIISYFIVTKIPIFKEVRKK